jgi:hypothetical protein
MFHFLAFTNLLDGQIYNVFILARAHVKQILVVVLSG